VIEIIFCGLIVILFSMLWSWCHQRDVIDDLSRHAKQLEREVTDLQSLIGERDELFLSNNKLEAQLEFRTKEKNDLGLENERLSLVNGVLLDKLKIVEDAMKKAFGNGG
jgi:hypothetical protein